MRHLRCSERLDYALVMYMPNVEAVDSEWFEHGLVLSIEAGGNLWIVG